MHVFSRRSAVVGILALGLNACVSVPERVISLSIVSSWRIAEVKVVYLDGGEINLENFAIQHAQTVTGQPVTGTGQEGILIDPAGGGRNLYQEKLAEIAGTEEAKANARNAAARIVADQFKATFANTPSGKVPVRLVVSIKSIASVGDMALINILPRFENISDGKLLLTGENFGHVRPSRRAQAVGAFIGGGLVGVAGVVIGAAIADGGRPEPFVDVNKVSSEKLRDWLMKP
jgi:hypothetical protein